MSAIDRIENEENDAPLEQATTESALRLRGDFAISIIMETQRYIKTLDARLTALLDDLKRADASLGLKGSPEQSTANAMDLVRKVNPQWANKTDAEITAIMKAANGQ